MLAHQSLGPGQALRHHTAPLPMALNIVLKTHVRKK